jgi:hypothetical protein
VPRPGWRRITVAPNVPPSTTRDEVYVGHANGVRRLTAIERLTTDTATITLTLEDEDLDDNALIPNSPGAASTATLGLTRLAAGRHYIAAIAFLRRTPGTPPIFQIFRKAIEVDRP